MAYEIKKTEHAGAKQGKGFWGKKADAKKQSKKLRRNNDKQGAQQGLSHCPDR